MKLVGIRKRRDYHIFIRRLIGEHASFHKQTDSFYHSFQFQ